MTDRGWRRNDVRERIRVLIEDGLQAFDDDWMSILTGKLSAGEAPMLVFEGMLDSGTPAIGMVTDRHLFVGWTGADLHALPRHGLKKIPLGRIRGADVRESRDHHTLRSRQGGWRLDIDVRGRDIHFASVRPHAAAFRLAGLLSGTDPEDGGAG